LRNETNANCIAELIPPPFGGICPGITLVFSIEHLNLLYGEILASLYDEQGPPFFRSVAKKALRSFTWLVTSWCSCRIHQNFPTRKILVEVSGIGPESLNNRIKAATCLAPHFNLSL